MIRKLSTHQAACIQFIKEVVVQETGVSIDLINSRNRTRDVAIARQIVMYYIRLLIPELPFREIAESFDVKFNHATVMHNIRIVENLCVYPEHKNLLRRIGAELKGINSDKIMFEQDIVILNIAINEARNKVRAVVERPTPKALRFLKIAKANMNNLRKEIDEKVGHFRRTESLIGSPKIKLNTEQNEETIIIPEA